MADIFVSYAREDVARAEMVVRGLEALGLECFWDTEIPPGQSWADFIEQKLSQCRAVVVLWSQTSAKSQWVREEARMARDQRRLIPAIIDGTTAPLGFGEVQAADLTHWQGDPNDPNWTRFANAVYAAARDGARPQAQPQAAWTPPPQQQAYAGASGAGETLSPIGYIQKCLRLYFDGKGRARRAEFGWFVLGAFVTGFIAGVLDTMIFGFNEYTQTANSYVLTLIAGLGLLAPTISAASRRAHDFGQSGWLAILVAIPYFGIVAALAFIFIPGQPGANKYGPNPKGQ